jgi:hypothetical protein
MSTPLAPFYQTWSICRTSVMGALFACSLAGGCSQAEPEFISNPTAAPPAATPVAGAQTFPVLLPTTANAAPVPADAPVLTDAPAPPPADPYQPPFPDRIELFVPPKRQAGSIAADGGGNDGVVLKGFVRVDKPRAVLLIDGQAVSMAAGESLFGVEVISIAQPNVLLQRGRQRWQTTLE